MNVLQLRNWGFSETLVLFNFRRKFPAMLGNNYMLKNNKLDITKK